MLVLCTAVADQLAKFEKEVKASIKAGAKKEEAIHTILKGYLKNSRRILFEGNGYSDEWVVEAEKRGLSNFRDTPVALDAYISDSTTELMMSNGIFSKEELHARYEINLEAYIKQIQIEGRLMGDLAFTRILPAVIRYEQMLADAIIKLKEAGLKSSAVKPHLDLLENVNENLAALKKEVDEMTEQRKKSNNIEDAKLRALAYCNKVKSHFDNIRYHADKLERLVDDRMWELPKYRELLFIK
jgi:glutamine synthetase